MELDLTQRIESEAAAYAGGEDRPLGSFVLIMGAYVAVVAGLSGTVWRSGRRLPDRLNWPDLLLLATATHKIARLLAKDPVTSPVRTPFARFSGTSGEAEVAEEVRGRGPRKALGELVTCPYCVGQWVVTGLAFGLVLAPSPTRFVAGMFTALTGADFLQLAFAKLQT